MERTCTRSAWGFSMGEVVAIKQRPRLRLVDDPDVRATWLAYVEAWNEHNAQPDNIILGIKAGKACARWLKLFEVMDA